MNIGLRLFLLNYVVVMIASPCTMLHIHYSYDQHDTDQRDQCYQNQIMEAEGQDRHHDNHEAQHCLFCQWQSHSNVVTDCNNVYAQFTNQQFLSSCPEQAWFQFFISATSSRAPPQNGIV